MKRNDVVTCAAPASSRRVPRRGRLLLGVLLVRGRRRHRAGHVGCAGLTESIGTRRLALPHILDALGCSVEWTTASHRPRPRGASRRDLRLQQRSPTSSPRSRPSRRSPGDPSRSSTSRISASKSRTASRPSPRSSRGSAPHVEERPESLRIDPGWGTRAGDDRYARRPSNRDGLRHRWPCPRRRNDRE